MSAALVVVVLVCGYLYINSHIPSKILFKKSTGWQSYFQVALKGSIYLTMGFFLILLVWGIVFLTMLIFNIPHFFKPTLPHFSFAYDLWETHIAGVGLPFVALVAATIMFSLSESKQAEKQLRDPAHRRKIFEEVAKSSPVEAILLESLDSKQQLLVSITLKSRKVYIGMVHEARLEEHDTDTVVVVPFLSGYRDKDTLSFIEEVNYADHYKECGITFTSQPISLKQYRHVIPRDQIESVSLFNSKMYQHFKKLKSEENKQ
ncbi:hypothetical protein [Kosakonia cowanii]|uniref:hypothetical protein n=1 Tax=Kosakonia cowanii TaxID=208223 RepID=UPI0021E9867A|nr:hypothetical protein [Kosakonia cowanii]